MGYNTGSTQIFKSIPDFKNTITITILYTLEQNFNWSRVEQNFNRPQCRPSKETLWLMLI